MSECFYKDGLHFECIRCSRCCRHAPGYVFLTSEDLKDLAAATGLTEKEFLRKYCHDISINGFRRVSLREKSNFDCILWEETGCRVYKQRPFQCRSYPFWTSNFFSLKSWEALRSSCPGIGKGRLHSREEIDAWLDKHVTLRFLTSIVDMMDGI